MVLKKDDDGRRWVEMEFLVPGTPEQVWEAIATGPGMSAWFTPTTVDEKVGGAIEFDFGDGTTNPAVITEWVPPSLLRYEEHGWSGEAPPLATEVVVTSRSGDRCVVRMVHSLFTDRDDWDDEMESFETGWPGFFEVLRLYLREFPGQRAATAVTVTQGAGDLVSAWSALSGALGIVGADVGTRFESVSEAPRLAGTVRRVHQEAGTRDVMIVLDAPGPGIAVVGACDVGGTARVMVTLYLYGESAADTAALVTPIWQDWMAQLVHADSAAP